MENRRNTIRIGPIRSIESINLAEEISHVITGITEPQTEVSQQVEQRKKGKKAQKGGKSTKKPQLTRNESAGSSQKADYMAEGVTSRYGRRIRQTERAKG